MPTASASTVSVPMCCVDHGTSFGPWWRTPVAGGGIVLATATSTACSAATVAPSASVRTSETARVVVACFISAEELVSRAAAKAAMITTAVIATSSTVPRWRLRAAIGGGREFRGYVMVLDPLL